MRRTLLSLSVAVLAFSACGNLLEPAAAVVNDKKVTIERIEDELNQFRKQERYKQLVGQGDVEAVERQFEQTLLSSIVRRMVLEPEAEDLGIEVTDEQVQAQIDAIKADFPTEGAFEEALKEQGVDPTEIPDLVRDRLVQDALREEVTKDVGATEEELMAAYETRIDEFQETDTSHILVDSRTVAQEISDQLQAASPKKVEDLFAKLAKKESNDTQSAENGGNLGYTRPGQLVPEYEEAVADLDEGEISEPVQSEFGFHVIRLIDRRTAPFEEARDTLDEEISTAARDDAWQSWQEAAYRDADVRINSRFGELDLATFQILDATEEDVPGAEAPEAPEPTNLESPPAP